MDRGATAETRHKGHKRYPGLPRHSERAVMPSDYRKLAIVNTSNPARLKRGHKSLPLEEEILYFHSAVEVSPKGEPVTEVPKSSGVVTIITTKKDKDAGTAKTWHALQCSLCEASFNTGLAEVRPACKHCLLANKPVIVGQSVHMCVCELMQKPVKDDPSNIKWFATMHNAVRAHVKGCPFCVKFLMQCPNPLVRSLWWRAAGASCVEGLPLASHALLLTPCMIKSPLGRSY